MWARDQNRSGRCASEYSNLPGLMERDVSRLDKEEEDFEKMEVLDGGQGERRKATVRTATGVGGDQTAGHATRRSKGGRRHGAPVAATGWEQQPRRPNGRRRNGREQRPKRPTSRWSEGRVQHKRPIEQGSSSRERRRQRHFGKWTEGRDQRKRPDQQGTSGWEQRPTCPASKWTSNREQPKRPDGRQHVGKGQH